MPLGKRGASTWSGNFSMLADSQLRTAGSKRKGPRCRPRDAELPQCRIASPNIGSVADWVVFKSDRGMRCDNGTRRDAIMRGGSELLAWRCRRKLIKVQLDVSDRQRGQGTRIAASEHQQPAG